MSNKGKFLFGVGEIKPLENIFKMPDGVVSISIDSDFSIREPLIPLALTSYEASGRIKINFDDFGNNIYEVLLFLNMDNMEKFKDKVWNHMNSIRRDIAEISSSINVNKKLLRAKKRELKLGEKYLNIENIKEVKNG